MVVEQGTEQTNLPLGWHERSQRAHQHQQPPDHKEFKKKKIRFLSWDNLIYSKMENEKESASVL